MILGSGRTNVLVVTGTGTGVGKTVATAAIAVLAASAGQRVAVLKPAQTGIRPGEPDSDSRGARGVVPPDDTADIETITRLSGVTDTHELTRYPDPLSPEAAARTSGLAPLDMEAAADYAAKLAADRDLVLVEGAGGLLVRYDDRGATLADLARRLRAPVLTVTAAGLGTLNHTALTLEALASRGIASAGVVIGSWPRDPGLAERQNLADLEIAAGGPLAGILPENAGRLRNHAFLTVARSGLASHLGGVRAPGAPPPSASGTA